MATRKKGGVPKEIINELDIHKKNKEIPLEVNVLVEEHQIKIPLPKKIRLRLKLEKGAKCNMSYNEEKKELICKF